MLRKLCWLGGVLGIMGIVVLLQRPYHDGALRYGLPVSILCLWSMLLISLWSLRRLRKLLLILPLVLILPFLLPGKPMDQIALRSDCMERLRGFEGTVYVWGGESRTGIDCSGLPRRALRDALFQQGVTGMNGAAFRQWARQWWFDTSAKAMGEGYRGFTCAVGISGPLRKLDFTQLEPGDLAITADGRHVMVHLENGNWIQADPGPGKVEISNPVTDSRAWFDAEVLVWRWVLLSE